eukprot:5276819-Amphidinium_carterae.1
MVQQKVETSIAESSFICEAMAMNSDKYSFNAMSLTTHERLNLCDCGDQEMPLIQEVQSAAWLGIILFVI